MRPFILLLLLACCLPAAARMYQWQDPDTGTTQLSGKPPYWYRGNEEGPRIFVIENGRVVDDTSVALPDAERQRLREEAFTRAEQDAAMAQRKLEEAREMQGELDRRQRRKQDENEEASAMLLPAPPSAEDLAAMEEEPVESGPTEEQMRALIEQWEQMRSREAHQVLGQEPPPPAAVPEQP